MHDAPHLVEPDTLGLLRRTVCNLPQILEVIVKVFVIPPLEEKFRYSQRASIYA